MSNAVGISNLATLPEVIYCVPLSVIQQTGTVREVTSCDWICDWILRPAAQSLPQFSTAGQACTGLWYVDMASTRAHVYVLIITMI